MMCGRGFNVGSKFGAKKVKFQFRPKRVEFQIAKRNRNGEDRISELPDDILHGILSALPLKEAGRTSVVSPRWRNLWRHTSSLNFDAHQTMLKVIKDEDYDSDFCFAAMDEYASWVNSVLRSHQGLTLNEFRICFYLDRAIEEISDWVKFALKRKVQRLELNLLFGDDEDDPLGPDERNVVPRELRNSQHPSLRSLCLRAVLVSGEDITCLLRNCPLLEQLIITSSDVLTSLEVCGSSLALKRLEIRWCRHLTSLKISAPNLTKLVLSEMKGLVLEDVPKLVNVFVQCLVILPALSCCFSQLEMLTLDFCVDLTLKYNFPEMLKLKKLVIMYFTSKADQRLLGLVSTFFKASPFLQEFVFKQSWSLVPLDRTNKQIDHKGKMFSHQHLNMVKFLGYCGCATDVELVNYFLKNCVALREIFVDPRDLFEVFNSWSYDVSSFTQAQIRLENEQTSRNYAKQQLEPLVPNHIELVIY